MYNGRKTKLILYPDHRKAFYASIAHVFDSRRKLVDEAYKTIPQLIYEDRER